MTRLLVSVRSADEALDAVSAGADLIDIKEPNRGSLGAAAAEVVAAAIDAVADRRPTSVALGELTDPVAAWPAIAKFLRPQQLPQFAKFGLAGCALEPNWPDRWSAARGTLPAAVAAVAVVYADWQVAKSPEPESVLHYAERLRCRAVLIDTFDKHGPGLLALWSFDLLARFVTAARGAGMLVVLGGQIRAEQFESFLPLAPDFIAVRGAACCGDRAGRLDPRRVERLRGLLPAVQLAQT
ncbi:MAG TPA: (5-formylfuran-3-yl)methyl phosphate synthase [Pirellulales bacterium]|jgi:hypothetical protein|nr:(5-formylfuran-3-yl)methyl phosphate synthase [Pirellulales bacterium]